MYESTINFTLDTICPWTFLAKRRLDAALAIVRAKYPDPDPPVKFTLHFSPYNLHPDLPAPSNAISKKQWYLTNKYNNSEEQHNKYFMVMTAIGKDSGIDFDFDGEISDTMDAHRLLWWVQEEYGGEKAAEVLDSLYTQYFTQALPPSHPSTLRTAALAAALPPSSSDPIITNPTADLSSVKTAIQEQKSNGVDAVPYVVFEGRRRDFTLQGAKEVEEYVKTLEMVVKESL